MRIAGAMFVVLICAGVLVWRPWDDRAAAPEGPNAAAGSGADSGDADPGRIDPLTGELKPRTDLRPAGGGKQPRPIPPVFVPDYGDDPETQLARRAGWQAGDPLAVEAIEWRRQVDVEQKDLLARLGRGDPRTHAEGFNDAMTQHRERLVQRVGAERANRVLRELPIYQFDLDRGSWHRVDAAGERVPFRDAEKEDVWQGFARKR